jgi:predicted nucleic acid-binding protein
VSRWVLDASVVVQLFFEERHSRAAERCLKRARDLLAPDLMWAEVANVVWKRQRRGAISQEDAEAILVDILALPVGVYEARGLLPAALDLAMRFGQSVYDCLYVALAVKTSSVTITADRRLADAFADTPLTRYLSWIGNRA